MKSKHFKGQTVSKNKTRVIAIGLCGECGEEIGIQGDFDRRGRMINALNDAVWNSRNMCTGDPSCHDLKKGFPVVPQLKAND